MLARVILSLFLTASVFAATLSVPVTNFLGGELSPRIGARTDVPQYQAGCRTLENMLVIGPGAVTRRPGTRYVAATRGANEDGTGTTQDARLESFIYSEADAYAMEFTPHRIRFYREDGQVLSAGVPYEVATAFHGNDIWNLQMSQSADVCYIADPNHPVQKLTRYDHASWTIADANFTAGPWHDENITTTQIKGSANTGTVTLIADANVWQAGHVGSLWLLNHVMTSQDYSGTFSGSTDSNIVTAGTTAPYNFSLTATTFAGTISLQISYDDGATWVNDYTVTRSEAGAVDVDVNGVSDFGGNVLLKLSCTAFTSGTCDWTLAADSYIHTGIVRIATYVDANEVTATTLSRVGIANEYTPLWREGAWNAVRGYPRSVTFHAGRIVYAQGLTLYWSHTDSYEDFAEGSNNNDAFHFTLSQANQSEIRWINGEKGKYLLCGSLAKLFEVAPSDTTLGFSPSNPPTIRSSVNISCSIQEPVASGTSILFADRTGRRIHEALYNLTEDNLVGPDVTMMADHITGATGVRQMASMRSPYNIVWCVRNDGEMATLAYDRDYSVAAWSRQVTSGDFTSVAIVPTENGQDRVWTVVKRPIKNSAGVASDIYGVEYFSEIDTDANVVDGTFLDSAKLWDGGDAVNITGITRANPGIVTVDVWPVKGDGTNMAAGDKIVITGVVGMTTVNDRVFTVGSPNVSAKTFNLLAETGGTNYTTAAFSAWASGGSVAVVARDFTTIGHLPYETVSALRDGVPESGLTVVASAISTSDYGNRTLIGLPYTSTVQPMPVELIGTSNALMPNLKSISALYMSYYNTVQPRFGIDSTRALLPAGLLKWPDTFNALGTYTTALLPKTEGRSTKFFGPDVLEANYVILQDQPYPMTIRAVCPVVSVEP